MASSSLSAVYLAVIDDVISKVRDDFIDSGAGEAILNELQQLWEFKMMQCGLLVIASVAADPDMSIISYGENHPSRGLDRTEETRVLYDGWLSKQGQRAASNALGETERRFEIFRDNLRYIDEHNAGDHSFRRRRQGSGKLRELLGVLDGGSSGGDQPDRDGEMISLSEQECNGGLMDYGFEFIINNGGIDTEDDYPYNANDGKSDQYRRNAKVVAIDSYENVPVNDEQARKKAVVNQPISIATEAGSRAFQLYKSLGLRQDVQG